MRAGQTEAAVDLARLAGMVPAGIICEIMKDDGSMARVPDLIEFCREHGLKMLTVAEVIRYRMEHERYVHRVGEALVDTRFGEFRLIAYESEIDGGESHVALVRGDVEHSEDPVLVRMHAHCLMGDVFGATGCECHATLEGALRRIAQEGGSADLSAPDFAGILGREGRRPNRSQLSSRAETAVVVRERKADSAGDWHWGADSVGSEPAPHPAADESSEESGGAGGVRD